MTTPTTNYGLLKAQDADLAREYLKTHLAAALDEIDTQLAAAIKSGDTAVITETLLALGAVTTNRLADGAVTTAKLADGAVTDAKLDSDTLTMLSGASGAIDLDAVGTVVMTGGQHDGVFVLAAAGLDGANLELMGRDHPTAPQKAFFDANEVTFRNADGVAILAKVGSLGVESGGKLAQRHAGAGLRFQETGKVSAAAFATESDTAVTFAVPFSAAPRVLVTLNDLGAGSIDQWHVAALSVTTTGFTLRIRNGSGSTTTAAASWLAEGAD